MIDLTKLAPVLEGYKEYFPKHCKDELYKWGAVKHFQDHWDIEADNFGEMFKEATAKTYNLLASGYAYPRAMILEFANADGEATRAMFRALYDEKRDLTERVDEFIAASENMRQKYGAESWRSHYQGINPVSTYLWLRYPDKYYIYKYEVFRAVAKELSSDFIPRRTGSTDNLVHGFRMYDEICEAVKADPSIRDMIEKELTPGCYPDPELKTATMDIGFYLTRFYLNEKQKAETENKEEWWPTKEEYDPGISVEDWIGLLNDKEVFDEYALHVIKCFKDYGGQATCKQLAVKYGESYGYYRNAASIVARRIVNRSHVPIMPRDEENSRLWPILFLGKSSDNNNDGAYIWRLRDELSEALDKIDLSKVPIFINSSEEDDPHGYWWLTASPKIWSFADIGVGEEQSYTLHNENGNKRRIYQNFLDAKAGDIVIGYEANPVKKIVALARITKENDGEVLRFAKTEGLASPIDLQTIKSCPELEKMEFLTQQNGSLSSLQRANSIS